MKNMVDISGKEEVVEMFPCPILRGEQEGLTLSSLRIIPGDREGVKIR